MIHALKMMGEYAQDRSDESLLSQIVENPNSNGKYNRVLVIVFKENDNGELIFDKVEVEEFSKRKLDKYAYKKGSPRGGDLTPTSKITDLEKTFRRIQRPLKKLCKKLNEEDEMEKMILASYALFKDEEISQEIYEELEKIEYDDNAVLTIAFREDKGLKYVGEIEKFTESLREKYEKEFYYKKSYRKAERESMGENSVCYICSEQSDKTYGYVGTFAFYTLDKPGFTSGGFNRGEAWKNYPVCPECAKVLNLGKKYLEKNLAARFCGINYFLVPKTIFASESRDNKTFFKLLEQLDKHKKMSLEEDTKKRLVKTQNNLFEAMSEFDNYVNFNLMFYEEINSAFRILLYIEDVLPSHMQEIFSVKEEVDEEDFFRNLKGKDGMFDLDFKFNLISDFFYMNQRNKPDFSKEFLEITNSIFTGGQISYHLLIDRFIAHLQDSFRNNDLTWYDNLKALMILKFLNKLELLNGDREGEERVVVEEKSDYRERIDNFLDQHSDVLNCNVKRLAFLEGVLAEKLLNIQRQYRDGATPFRARLNGLQLNEKVVKRLYRETINKLEEYDKNYYKELEKMIADYIMVSDFKEISNNELSFYFVTGMNQAHKFSFEKND